MPAYKQMQAAFTKKTQEIAQARKEAEALKATADKYGRYEPYVPIIEEMLKGNQQKTDPRMQQLEQQLKGAGYSDEAIDMMKISAGFLLSNFDQTLSSQQAQAKLSVQIDEAEALDPRLNDDTLTYQTQDGNTVSFGDIVANLVKADSQWQQDPVASTKRAIQIVDAMLGQAKVEGKQELSASAQAKANKFPATSSSPQGTTSNSKPATIREAAKQAAADLGISLH